MISESDEKKPDSLIFRSLPLLFFITTIIFQVTVLKYVWAVEAVSRGANIVSLIFLSALAFACMACKRLSGKIWFFYIIPGALVFMGMSINILRSSIADTGNISYLGQLIPWAAYLTIPFFLKADSFFDVKLWKYFYYFMLVGVICGLFEYYRYSGAPQFLRPINTSGGPFLSGLFSIYYELPDGAVHYRFYGMFLEPGTLAMFLLTVMTYALFTKRYLGMFVLFMAFLKADSLGATICLVVLIFTISTYLVKSRLYLYLLCVMGVIIVSAFFMEGLLEKYSEKHGSKTVREENIVNGVVRLPSMMINNPLGFRLHVDMADSDNENYSGSTFMPVYKMVVGGIFAFAGYIAVISMCLWVSLFSLHNRYLLQEEKVVFSTMIPLSLFLVQRTTIWESALFAFLFAPSIIRYLNKSNISHQNFIPVAQKTKADDSAEKPLTA